MNQHPRLPGLVADGLVIGDAETSWPVSDSAQQFTSPYVTLSLDTIVDPSGAEHSRAVVRPHGAVGVVALDEDDRILLVEQYRHAVRHRLIEIPAGTLDLPGEAPAAAAARELSEEADVVADTWAPLLTLYATPGYSTERWEVFLATGLTPTPDADRIERQAEEADMRQLWIPFDDAVEAVLGGRIHDSMTVGAILAVAAIRRLPA